MMLPTEINIVFNFVLVTFLVLIYDTVGRFLSFLSTCFFPPQLCVLFNSFPVNMQIVL